MQSLKKTVIILAGGRSRRFYFDKSFFMLNNKELINHVVCNVESVADEIIVAARDDKQAEEIRKRCSTDIIFVFDFLKNLGPLAGILSGLERASFDYSFVIGCDMPYVNEGVVKFLFEIASAGCDAVVPKWKNGMTEPLHAVYRNGSMLNATKRAVSRGELKISTPLSRLKKVEFVSVEKIREIDLELKTFLNINTLGDVAMKNGNCNKKKKR